MAKVTVTFEDIEEGVSVRVESNPPFPNPAHPDANSPDLTEAQHMGIHMTQLLTERLAGNEIPDESEVPPHEHGENCGCNHG